MNIYWILSSTYSTSINRILWFFFFRLSILWITFIHFWILCFWAKSHLVVLWFYIYGFNLLIFHWGFLCLCLWEILACSFFLFFCSFCLWYQSNVSHTEWIGKCSMLCCSLEDILYNWRYFFKCLVEFVIRS